MLFFDFFDCAFVKSQDHSIRFVAGRRRNSGAGHRALGRQRVEREAHNLLISRHKTIPGISVAYPVTIHRNGKPNAIAEALQDESAIGVCVTDFVYSAIVARKIEAHDSAGQVSIWEQDLSTNVHLRSRARDEKNDRAQSA